VRRRVRSRAVVGLVLHARFPAQRDRRLPRHTEYPDAPDLAIAAAAAAMRVLEPLQATFGRLAIRSAYRAPAVNSSAIATGSAAPRTYAGGHPFGTVLMPPALWGRWRPSAVHHCAATATAIAPLAGGSATSAGSSAVLPN
jgi:hypothetical protein